jgi:hypothetical protein
MTPFRRLAVLAAGGLLSAVAVAQLDAAQDRAEGATARPVAPPAALDPAAERAEDIEVLRRILNNSLGLPNKVTGALQVWPSHQGGISGFGGVQPGGFGGQPGGFGGQGLGGFGGGGLGGTAQPGPYNPFTGVVTQPNIGPFDGVYLAGHGVAFTLHVPEQLGFWLRPPDRAAGLTEFCTKCHATEPTSRSTLEPVASGGKPASEWDRVRDELQGKKPEAKSKQPTKESQLTVCEPGKTAHRLVAKLAQNARHVRHLPANERVTAVVTYDGMSGSSRDRQVTTLPAGGGSSASGSRGRAGLSADEVKQFALGDLHLKQGKPREAADAYERALTRYSADVITPTFPPGLSPDQVKQMAMEYQGGIQDGYRKLAMAFLTSGDVGKAETALERARQVRVSYPAYGTVAGKAIGIPVPAKLVVSVAKADLDKAGDDPTALTKAVRVELTGFPSPEKKK